MPLKGQNWFPPKEPTPLNYCGMKVSGANVNDQTSSRDTTSQHPATLKLLLPEAALLPDNFEILFCSFWRTTKCCTELHKHFRFLQRDAALHRASVRDLPTRSWVSHCFAPEHSQFDAQPSLNSAPLYRTKLGAGRAAEGDLFTIQTRAPPFPCKAFALISQSHQMRPHWKAIQYEMDGYLQVDLWCGGKLATFIYQFLWVLHFLVIGKASTSSQASLLRNRKTWEEWIGRRSGSLQLSSDNKNSCWNSFLFCAQEKKDRLYIPEMLRTNTHTHLLTENVSNGHSLLFHLVYAPFGGKYDLLSALCGQSTTNGPNLLNAAVISSEKTQKCSLD